jgi:hypothetical protein
MVYLEDIHNVIYCFSLAHDLLENMFVYKYNSWLYDGMAYNFGKFGTIIRRRE